MNIIKSKTFMQKSHYYKIPEHFLVPLDSIESDNKQKYIFEIIQIK